MTTFGYETLAVSRIEPDVLVVMLNRPDSLNAVNTQMGRDLLDLWTRLTRDPGLARCVVLTGAGDRAFCAGGDLKERNGMTDDAWRAQHLIFENGFMALLECPLPIIAAVNGHALGGGLEIAMGCDFMYVVRGARLGLSEVSLGIMPGSGGTQTLPRAAGERRAKEIILTAKPFSADEAVAWGIANRVCEQGETLSAATETAARIAENAPLSVRQAKKSIHYGLQMDLDAGYRFEIEAYYRLVTTEDRLEGVRAFSEKRKPQFMGR